MIPDDNQVGGYFKNNYLSFNSIPPIGFLAAWTYYKQGYVDLKIASFICIGFFIGGLIGAKFATKLSNVTLERVFGVALLMISLKMIFAK